MASYSFLKIDDYGVYEPENFAYLAKGNCLDIDGVDDVEEWGLTRNAMNVIGILFIIYMIYYESLL